MPVYKYGMTWQGFSGAPGYMNWFFSFPGDPDQDQVNAAAIKSKTFVQNFAAYLPTGVSVAYPGIIERLTTGTGELEAEINVPVQTATVGTGGGNWSAAVGMCVNWRSGAIVNGRRLRGRTFFVPLSTSAYDTAGTLNDTVRTNILSAANTFITPDTNLQFAIWHRPSPGGSDGSSGAVVATSITDKTAVLKSRRD